MGERTENPLVSVCIPTYDNGDQKRILRAAVDSIINQTYDSIEIIISDQDAVAENDVSSVKFNHESGIPISYVAFEGERGPSYNTNNAIAHATGDYIKLLNHDDFLDSDTAIEGMVDLLRSAGARWLASSCIHTNGEGVERVRPHRPSWPGEKAMVEGVNRIGCPSVIMFDSKLKLECDPKILYAMDCDLWIQLFRQAGPPIIHDPLDVVVRMWDNQLTENLDIPTRLELDKAAMRAKYGYK